MAISLLPFKIAIGGIIAAIARVTSQRVAFNLTFLQNVLWGARLTNELTLRIARPRSRIELSREDAHDAVQALAHVFNLLFTISQSFIKTCKLPRNLFQAPAF